MHNVSYHPVLSVSLEAKEQLYGGRFVNHLGSLCRGDQKSLGVSEVNWQAGEIASVVTLGTIAVETSASVNAGDNIASDTNGRAKIATGTNINGRALESTIGAGVIKMILLP